MQLLFLLEFIYVGLVIQVHRARLKGATGDVAVKVITLFFKSCSATTNCGIEFLWLPLKNLKSEYSLKTCSIYHRNYPNSCLLALEGDWNIHELDILYCLQSATFRNNLAGMCFGRLVT